MSDITYSQDKMFTTFYAENENGAILWNEMASQMDGVAKVLNFEAQKVISQIKQSGYSVAKAKKVTMSDDVLLSELGLAGL